MTEPLRAPDMASLFNALQGHYALLKPDAGFAVVAISDSLLAIMHNRRQDVLGRPVLSLFGGNATDRPGHGARILRSSLEKVLYRREADCLPAMRIDLPGADGDDDAEAHYLTLSNSPVVDLAGRLTGILLHAENIGMLMRAEQARHADEALNRQILDSARDFAIIGTDLEGQVTFWNEGASRVLGWSEAEMLGQTAACIFTPEDLAQDVPSADMRKALEDGHASDERWHVRRNGRRI
jgi:PAS domain S-box-containing protein